MIQNAWFLTTYILYFDTATGLKQLKMIVQEKKKKLVFDLHVQNLEFLEKTNFRNLREKYSYFLGKTII